MHADIIRKMIKPATLQEADPAVDGLAGVLGKAASVAGLSALEVQLEAKSRGTMQCEPASFIEALPENGLYFRIICEDATQFGLLALHPSLTETLGNVLTGALDGSEAPARAPTAVDTALTRPYLDEMLKEFAQILRELRGGKVTNFYETAQIEPEPSPHLFPEIPYLNINIDFDFMGGKGKGQLALMLPAANTAFTSALPRPGKSSADWRASFAQALDGAPASFNVVLHRKKMPIGQILKLKSGDTLDIPARALESLSLESQNGHSLIQARLGEYQEMRAAKVTRIGEETPPDDTPKQLTVDTQA